MKHCGKFSFFVISENIHAQNANNERGRSIKISSIAHSFCIVLRNVHNRGCKGKVAVIGIIPGERKLGAVHIKLMQSVSSRLTKEIIVDGR